jgi:hypothetical protein
MIKKINILNHLSLLQIELSIAISQINAQIFSVYPNSNKNQIEQHFDPPTQSVYIPYEKTATSVLVNLNLENCEPCEHTFVLEVPQNKIEEEKVVTPKTEKSLLEMFSSMNPEQSIKEGKFKIIITREKDS